MKKLSFAFLLNPVSGGRQGAKIEARLLRALKNLSLSPERFHLQFTQPGQIVSRAQQLAHEADRLIAVGGDGTAVETITGAYLSGSRTLVGILPLGTGNDLARSVNVYTLFKKAGFEGCLQQFLKGSFTPLDIWQVNKKELMTNYLSIGLDAAVVNTFHRKRATIPFDSALANRVFYTLIGLCQPGAKIQGNLIVHLWSVMQKKQISLPDHRSVIISNLPFYAGGTVPAPQADFSDGMLEVTPFFNLMNLLGLFVVKGNRSLQAWYGRRFAHFQANRIAIDVPEGNFLQVDGEDKTFLLADRKLEIELGGQISLLTGR